MSRLTRAESHARTRQQLIATARELFSRDGFVATSLDRVAADAGFSKGAVYSSFATKDDLCLAVLDQIHEEQMTMLVDALGTGGTVSERLAGFARWAEESIGDQEWTALEVELAMSGRRNGRLLAELALRRRQVTARVTDLIEQQARSLGVSLPMPAAEAALLLLGLGIGLGVQRAVDPELSVGSLVDLAERILGA